MDSLIDLEKEFYSWREYMFRMVLEHEWAKVAEAATKLAEIKARGDGIQAGIKIGVGEWGC